MDGSLWNYQFYQSELVERLSTVVKIMYSKIYCEYLYIPWVALLRSPGSVAMSISN